MPISTVNQNSVGTPVAGTGPAFSAYKSAAQTISPTTWTKIQFQTEEFDTAAAFDSTTNYRFQPQVAGYYQVSGGFAIITASTTNYAAIYKNGASFKNLNGITLDRVYGSCLVYLNGSTDYIELYGYSGATNAIATDFVNTYFQAVMVRAA
jgi:hypothetical protein